VLLLPAVALLAVALPIFLYPVRDYTVKLLAWHIRLDIVFCVVLTKKLERIEDPRLYVLEKDNVNHTGRFGTF